MTDSLSDDDRDLLRRAQELNVQGTAAIEQLLAVLREHSVEIARLSDVIHELRRRLEDRAGFEADLDLLNRRGFAIELAREEARARRFGLSAAVVAIEVLPLDELTVHGGPASGTITPQLLGAILRPALRASDIVGYLDARQFVFLLPGTGFEGAQALLQRLDAASLTVEAADGTRHRLRFRTGVATRDEAGSLARALEAAQERMLRDFRTARAPAPRAGPVRPGETPGVAAAPHPPYRPPQPQLARDRRRQRATRLSLLGLLLLVVPVIAVVVAQLMSNPAPAGGPQATPAASLTPPETPRPGPPSEAAELRLPRDLSGRCIPEPGRAVCDALRAALWAGDTTAWAQWAASQGMPPLTRDQIQAATLDLRQGAGDPAARMDVAQRTAQPLPLITAVRLRLRDGAREVISVELANLGAAPSDLTGAALGHGIARLAPGVVLPPAGRCVIGMPAEGCATVSFNAAVRLAAGDRIDLIDRNGNILDTFPLP